MAIYMPETDEIYFPKTREYFQEVLSSYSNGNYRSAIVMLYSIAICDLLFKLKELKDMYNDSVATQILKEVDKSRNGHDNKSKSKWERELIEHIRKETELLDLESYTNLSHLYDHRNFSAHPALNENYELISPSKETTIAHIKNILNSILIKPPIFIKNIVDALTEDLKEKRELYYERRNELAIYLNNKYYRKMSGSMKLTTIKALWKFCFCLPEDKDCMENLSINCQALSILIDSIPEETVAYMKQNEQLFMVSPNEQCVENLILLLSQCPILYPILNSDTKLQVERMIEKDMSCKSIAWFKYASPQEHIKSLYSVIYKNVKVEDEESFDLSAIQHLTEHYAAIGELPMLIDFFIEYYGKSLQYDTANKRFDLAIAPHIDRMTDKQIIRLIEVTNNNSQIHERRAARRSNNAIVQRARKVLPADFDYSIYVFFEFDETEAASE